MNSSPRILAFAGSTRSGSFNKMLAKEAGGLARAAGAEVTVLDLRDLALPLYDGDLESASGLPAGAKQFKAMLVAAQGLVIAAPEYNSSVTATLKNAIDWASRPAPGEAPLIAFQGKVAALLAASPGALGGLRGLVHLRAILGNIGVLVLPDQLAIGKAMEAFDGQGALVDTRQKASLDRIVKTLVATVAKLTAGS